MPTSGADLPGQSALPAPASAIVVLDAAPGQDTNPPQPSFPGFPISGFYGPSGWDAIGNTTGPVYSYTRDTYPGLVPHLPPNPGTLPMTEATVIPGTDWAVDWSWGKGPGTGRRKLAWIALAVFILCFTFVPIGDGGL